MSKYSIQISDLSIVQACLISIVRSTGRGMKATWRWSDVIKNEYIPTIAYDGLFDSKSKLPISHVFLRRKDTMMSEIGDEDDDIMDN